MTDNKTGAEEETVTYTYDAAGNRLTETKGGNTTSYSYNNLNQLTEATETGTGSSAIRTYSYDRNGNQTAEVTKEGTVETERRTFTYDEANRLTGLSVKEGETVTLTQSNRYNGEGQRIEKVETKLASGLEGTIEETEKTEYYYQNDAVLYTEDVNGNRSSMNLMGASGNIIATSRGTGDSESWYLYNKDIRESTSSIIGADGNATATYEYDDFGNTTITSGEDFNNEICYTGQIYDRSSGLYYYNARFYDPENGRFITQDTYRGESNEPDTLHLYAYCANDPINYSDNTGNKKSKNKKKYETLGWGVTIQASIGQIISSASVGLDIVWFNKNVKTRYKGKQTHAFWHIDSDISAGLAKGFKQALKKKKTKIFSKDGLKVIKKSIKKNARFNGTLSAIFFKVYAKKNKVNNYLDFEGECSNANFSIAHFTANVGWSGKCKTVGIGITLSTAGIAGGTSNYYFNSSLTDSFRGVFSKSKVKSKAKS